MLVPVLQQVVAVSTDSDNFIQIKNVVEEIVDYFSNNNQVLWNVEDYASYCCINELNWLSAMFEIYWKTNSM